MGTKAIFKIYNDGKFVMGSWVKYGGNIDGVFQHFISSLKDNSHKKIFYDNMNQFVNDMNYGFLNSGDKKKPFSTQINDDGMKECEVLFWDFPLSDKKLLEQQVWGEYTYEVRYTKSKITIKVNYNGNEKVFVLKGYYTTNQTNNIVNELVKWVDEIEYGLNDCNCKEDEK